MQMEPRKTQKKLQKFLLEKTERNETDERVPPEGVSLEICVRKIDV